MLLRNLSETQSATLLNELSDGLPTIAAYARLCGQAITGEAKNTELSAEAKALAAAARQTGMFDIRGDKNAFETSERFLAVCVEIDSNSRLLFRDKTNPRQTILFLDGFRQLCQAGFILHHMLKDFSFSKSGFEFADSLDPGDFQELIEFACEVEH